MSGSKPQAGTLDAATPHVRLAAGLTLLEVLAAFLIFSMVFTVLVGTSQRGVKSQGVGARRLLANEIADREMANLEAPMVGRTLPSVPEDEIQEDDFVIRIASTALAADSTNANSALGDASEIDLGGTGGSLAALAAQAPEVSKYLFRYDIEVEWTEGASTQSVHRTTFAFDWTGAAQEYAELFTQGGAAGFAASAASATAGAATAANARGSDASAGGEAGESGDRERGAGAGSNAELQKIIADFCRENAAAAPEVCGG